jgi:DNA-binding NarL/FixJ family response regulator
MPPDTSIEPDDIAPSHAWQDVLSGRFRIVDWYDHQGRRYLVTRPNPQGGLSPLAPRERRVLALRARGAALKVIAFELGVSMSTAARDLGRAMALLGLESSADLAAVLGHGNR